LLDENGLCTVHGPTSGAVLPRTCADYPRLYRDSVGDTELVWALSCPQVAKLVCMSPDGRVSIRPEDGQSEEAAKRHRVLEGYNEARGECIADVFATVCGRFSGETALAGRADHSVAASLAAEPAAVGVCEIAVAFWRTFLEHCADSCGAPRASAMFRALAQMDAGVRAVAATATETGIRRPLRSIGGHLLWSVLEPGRSCMGAVVEAAVYLAIIRIMTISGIVGASRSPAAPLAPLIEATYITYRYIVQNRAVRQHMRRTAQRVAGNVRAVEAILWLLRVTPEPVVTGS